MYQLTQTKKQQLSKRGFDMNCYTCGVPLAAGDWVVSRCINHHTKRYHKGCYAGIVVDVGLRGRLERWLKRRCKDFCKKWGEVEKR